MILYAYNLYMIHDIMTYIIHNNIYGDNISINIVPSSIKFTTKFTKLFSIFKTIHQKILSFEVALVR